MEGTLKPLSVAAVKEAMEQEVVVLDSRPSTLFTLGFVPGSINIGLDGKYAEWAEMLLPAKKPLVLVTQPGQEVESAQKLQDKGFTIAGYLEGGFDAWRNSGEEVDLIIDIEADEMAMDLPFDENILVMDVRQPNEFAEGHVVDAENVPLAEFTDLVNIANIEEEQNVYIHCGAGYRSVIAASLLKRQGIHNLRNILGGWDAIREEPRIKKTKEEKKKSEE
ncbi:Rhodanese-related sulfurtransferase [Cnuella takakiae]|uniref:Rhodanese-related sulfurtransferase n=1 Tax=Cnuella takakiae TaxID=1302690 RepID=A0A1M5DPJ9_9BACT|nr:rhodanese-like domain-containing protein [Cnuella takakiae]OLY93916.1 rhodanese [Cnuella takakiae]SHF68826.1 Rhodanese-related sulfurtransferase [Cnuella takakiae]